jgi:hypothetical protein
MSVDIRFDGTPSGHLPNSQALESSVREVVHML